MRAPSRVFLFVALAAAVALFAAPRARLHAADAPLVKVTGVETTTNAAPRSTAHVTVTDTHGVPVAGLQPGDFQVMVDGKLPSNIAVQPGEESGAGLTAALALDTSGSMTGQPLIDLQNAADAFVNALAPDDQVALIDFGVRGGSGVRTDVPLTADHNAVLNGVATLSTGGDTPLFDAIETAVASVSQGPVGRRAVVLMTDGGENTSALRLDTIVNQAAQAGVPVYVVGLGSAIDSQTLQLLADGTGGTFQNAPTSDALAQSFTSLAQQLRGEYQVVYDAPASNRDSQHALTVAVNVNGASGRDDAQYSVAAVISQHVAVTLISPTDGQSANGDVIVQADVQPAVSAQSVRFLVNGAEIGMVQTPPFSATWHPGSAGSGAYAVRVEATGIDGQTVNQQATVQYTTPHVTVQLLSPHDGARITASTEIRADISPAASARNVHFDLDGTPLVSLQGPPWMATLDPRKTTFGQRTITVSATGIDGQTVTAQEKLILAAPDSNAPVIVSLVLLVLALAAVTLAILVGRGRARRRHKAQPRPGGLPLSPYGIPPYVAPVALGLAAPGWLEEKRPDGTSLRWPLQNGETLIGREVTNPNILLDDQDVSRLHAAVHVQNC
jgi:VWFA-related protein